MILDKAIIKEIDSFVFYKNSILTYHYNGILKASNILNNNLFWKTDISKLLKGDDKIIHATNYLESLIIFFQNGIILEIDSKNGNVISVQNLKIKNIKSIYFNQNKIFITQKNGKTSIFSQ